MEDEKHTKETEQIVANKDDVQNLEHKSDVSISSV